MKISRNWIELLSSYLSKYENEMIKLLRIFFVY